MEKDTKTILIENAEKLIALNGFHNTTIEDITKESKVAKGTFYVYFKTKEDILNEIFEYRGIGYAENINKIIKSNKSFLEKLKEMTKYHIEFGLRNKEFFKLMIKVFENADKELSQKIKERHLKSRNLILKQIESLIKEGIESNQIRDNFYNKTLEIANIYDAIRNHYIFLIFSNNFEEICREKEGKNINEIINIDEAVDFIIDIFINGVKKNGGE